MPAKKTTNGHNSLLELLAAFPTELACVQYLESLRWPTGIVCPLCGCTEKIYHIKAGLGYKCGDCKGHFSVRKGTIFEESRLPLQKWFAASWLITANRKGISSCQLAREIGVTQKTAWFMLGRLREVAGAVSGSGGPMDGVVEADETFIGGKEKNKHAHKRTNAGRGSVGKQAVAGARERNGRVKAALIESTSRENLYDFITGNVTLDSTLYTDGHPAYAELGYRHDSVNHSGGQYVKGDCHTNGIESFWALLKRGYYGIFHHFSVKHLHRYLAEFEARWNMSMLDGTNRVEVMLESAPGLRLTYKRLIAV